MHRVAHRLEAKNVMKLSVFVRLGFLLTTASALPQAIPQTVPNLTEIGWQCHPADNRHPKVNYDDCKPAMDAIAGDAHYWIRQRWDLFEFPLLMAESPTCRILLNAKGKASDRFSAADINARAFYVLAECDPPREPGAGGMIDIGYSGVYAVNVQGALVVDQDQQDEDAVVPPKGSATS